MTILREAKKGILHMGVLTCVLFGFDTSITYAGVSFKSSLAPTIKISFPIGALSETPIVSWVQALIDVCRNCSSTITSECSGLCIYILGEIEYNTN